MLNIRSFLKFKIQNIPFVVGLLLLLILARRSQQNWQTLAEFVENRKYYDLIAVKNGINFIDKPPITKKEEIEQAVADVARGAHRNTVFILGESRFAPQVVVQPIHKFSKEEVDYAEKVWADPDNHSEIYGHSGHVFGFKNKTYQAIATNVVINGTRFELLAFTSISRTIEKAYQKSLIELTLLLGTVATIVLVVLTAASRAVTDHARNILSKEKSIIKAWWPSEIKVAAKNYNDYLDAEKLHKIQIDQSTSGQMVVRSKGIDGGIIHAPNKALLKITGWAELEGAPLNLIVPEKYHQFHFGLGQYDHELGRRVGMAAYAQGCPFHNNHKSRIVGRDRSVELLHKDGSIRKVILGVFYVGRSGGIDEWVGVITDVTELTDAIETERATKEEFEQLQQSWRHDLLSAVLGTHNMFEVLDKIGFKVEDPEYQEPYNLARAKAQFAYRLVRDTRNLSASIENLERSPITLRSLLASIKILFPEANISYSITDEDAQVSVNESSLVGRAISNIINNAIKFSGLNGIIEVGIRTKDNHAIIFVKDNGIGMDEEGQKKIFNGLGTGVRLRQDLPGDGLGLYSANKIIKAHDGTLTVKSQLGQGSVFFIKIPLSQ